MGSLCLEYMASSLLLGGTTGVSCPPAGGVAVRATRLVVWCCVWLVCVGVACQLAVSLAVACQLSCCQLVDKPAPPAHRLPIPNNLLVLSLLGGMAVAGLRVCRLRLLLWLVLLFGWLAWLLVAWCCYWLPASHDPAAGSLSWGVVGCCWRR